MAPVRPAEVSSRVNAATGRVNPQALVDWVMKNAAGKPYQWGGTGPSGYDCSGLVMMAFKGAGLPLRQMGGGNRSTTLINGTHQVDLQTALRTPGAIVYMPPGKSGIPHIGISMGNGKVLESRGGKGVGIYDASEVPWKVGGLVEGMSNLPPDLGPLNNVKGGGQIGGSPSGAGGTDSSGGTGSPGAAEVDATAPAGPDGSFSTTQSTPTSIPTPNGPKSNPLASMDEDLLKKLWEQLDKRTAKSKEEIKAALTPLMPKAAKPEAASKLAGALAGNDQLAEAAKDPETLKQMMENPEAVEQLAKLLAENPQLAEAAKDPASLKTMLGSPDVIAKLASGEVNATAALEQMKVAIPQGGGSFAPQAAGSGNLVDLSGGSTSRSGESSAAAPQTPVKPELVSQINANRFSIPS